MSMLSLFALTPRAGRHHHRYLASPDDVRSGAELEVLFSRPNGALDMVKSVRRVIQPSTGREGDEILLLVVHPPARLTAAGREELRRRLEEKATELDKLVTTSIDWEHEGQELVVQRPELRAWANGLSQFLTSPRPRPWLQFGALIIILFIALLGVPAYLMWQGKGRTSKQDLDEDKKSNYTAWIRQMTKADENGEQPLTVDTLQLGLIECVEGASLTDDEKNTIKGSWNGIKKKKPEERVDYLLKSPSVRSYLEKPYSPTAFILPGKNQKDQLESLLSKGQGGIPPMRTVRIRQCLWKAAMKLAEMRKRVDRQFAIAEVDPIV